MCYLCSKRDRFILFFLEMNANVVVTVHIIFLLNRGDLVNTHSESDLCTKSLPDTSGATRIAFATAFLDTLLAAVLGVGVG